jgi:hypothetical protein
LDRAESRALLGVAVHLADEAVDVEPIVTATHNLMKLHSHTLAAATA